MLEGAGALARWKVYGPVSCVSDGHFMRQVDAERYANEANAIHAHALKIAKDVLQSLPADNPPA